MIKHKWRPALAGLLVFGLAAVAWGSAQDAPWREQQLNFVFRNATRSNQTRDSSVVTQKASYGTTSLVDTTESFNLSNAYFRQHSGWLPPQILPAAASAGIWSIVDTGTVAFTIRVGSPNGGATGFDTIAVSIQASPDNITWTNLDSLGRGSSVTVSPALGNTPVLLDATTGMGTMTLFTTTRGIGKARINWDRIPCNYIRLIVREDPNAPASTGSGVQPTEYAVWVGTKRLEGLAPPAGAGFR